MISGQLVNRAFKVKLPAFKANDCITFGVYIAATASYKLTNYIKHLRYVTEFYYYT